MEYLSGIVVSFLVEVFKKYGGLSSLWVQGILIVLSLGVGYFWTFLQDTSYWELALQVLTSASAFHNLVLRKFE